MFGAVRQSFHVRPIRRPIHIYIYIYIYNIQLSPEGEVNSIQLFPEGEMNSELYIHRSSPTLTGVVVLVFTKSDG